MVHRVNTIPNEGGGAEEDIVLGNRYASLKDGTRYYPKDQFGNEYIIPSIGMIEENRKYIYPLYWNGKPIYRVEQNTEIYEMKNGIPIIGTGTDGNEYYAVNSLGNEYYPDNKMPAKLADGTPYYASSKDGVHILPVDRNGNEYYITEIDLMKPLTNPNRYALSSLGDEIYPFQLTDIDNEVQYLIDNKYAMDRNKKFFYPKDGFGNEYYRLPTFVELNEYYNIGTINKILLDRYALTNDGKIILPEITNKFYIDSTMEPKITELNVIGKLVRDNGVVRDYLTNVDSTSFKSSQMKPYYYKVSITNEKQLVIPKQPPTTINVLGIFNISLPFYKRGCFWILLILLLIVKGFIVWWWFFKKPKNIFNMNDNRLFS